MSFTDNDLNSIAIIGMAGRFPGADNLADFWKNLVEGVESIVALSDAALQQAGIPDSLLQQKHYVKRSSHLQDVGGFDAEFFDVLPTEAELIDPQHRLLLECAYEAIEHAGYNPFEIKVPVGVYAGVGLSDYLLANVALRREFIGNVDSLQALMGNDKSYACTRISHKLNLHGPSVSVDSACSTSLVAVHMACKALLLYECDMALAGGAKIIVPHACGYTYQAGGIMSPDGVCRPFDAQASGTVQGSGVGMVFLKRLVDALQDRDVIHAVIRGSAINNDGREKIGYTAPGVQGQAQVVSQALSVANVEADSIDYIEAHGTGTSLGDPIEIKALTLAYQDTPASRCAIGSLKSNIGHLDVAAGVAGLIKTTLALQKRQLPPSLHYRKSNPEIDFSSTPFYVNTVLQDWVEKQQPRRAAVSSFGIGGTNAHVILEEPPAFNKIGSQFDQAHHIFCLSARSPAALEQVRRRFLDFIETSDERLADIAYTLNTGRAHFQYRLTPIAASKAALRAALQNAASDRIVSSEQPHRTAFLFTGQGAQYIGMGKVLYHQYPVFRACIDEIADYMHAHLNQPLLDLLWNDSHASHLHQTRYTQPALFAIEYSLAVLWKSFGVHPDYVIGHSVGEIAAACYAGMLSLREGVQLICCRAQVMQTHGAAGEMLAVLSDEKTVAHYLKAYDGALSIAAINSPKHCVVSGPAELVAKLAQTLKDAALAHTRLHVSQAYHSSAMDAALEPFRQAITDITFQLPNIPIVSNLSAQLPVEQLCNPNYWVRQMREPVYFKQGIEFLLDNGINTFIEVGPAPVLSKLGQACASGKALRWLYSLERQSEQQALAKAVAQYYQGGGKIDWPAFYTGSEYYRVALPCYPFQRKRYWTLPDNAAGLLLDAAQKPQYAIPDVQPETIMAVEEERGYPLMTTLQRRMATIWSELLGVASVGLNDNFFALGGHSLLIVQLHDKLEKLFSTQLPLNTLIENPSLHTFTAALEHNLMAASHHDALPAIQADLENRYQPFPLVELQQAFLLGRSSSFGLGGVSTHLYFELKPKNFVYEQFVNALNALIKRHDMLRAIVVDDMQQRILPEVDEYKVRCHDFSDKSSAKLESHLQNLRDSMSHQVMPADRWPLYDIRVTRVSAAEYIVHFSIDLLMLDVRSNQILFRDLDLLYLGKEQHLPTLSISYRDYVIARHKMKRSEAFNKARTYWLARIPDMPLAPDLPLCGNPSDIHQPQFKRRLELIDKQTTHRLRVKAQGMGITPSVLLMTAYGMILSRWSKRPAFTLNLTVFDRLPLHPDVNQLIGDFTTVSLLCMDYSEALCFTEHARRVQRQLWRDAEHKQFDGVEVLRELTRFYQGEQPVTMPVVFTSALPLDEGYTDELPEYSLLAGLQDGFSISQTPQVWIDHVVSEEAGQWVLSWDAIEDLFPTGMLDAMFAAYVSLVNNLATDDELWRKTHVDVMPEVQRRQRETINRDTVVTADGRHLIELFIAQVEKQPDAIAVIHNEYSLRYAELYAYAGYWANYLSEQGVGSNELVAIVMEKGWQQIVAAYAIQLAGAAYVPVDAHLPLERQLQILELAECKLALTQAAIIQKFPWPSSVIPAVIERTDTLPNVRFSPNISCLDDLAYVLFTSGSTGTPKGVMIDHRSSCNTLCDVIERFDIQANDRALAVCSLNFDMSVFDMFGMLIAGGSIVIPDHEVVRDAQILSELMRKHHVSVINTVPAMVQILVDYHEVLNHPLPADLRLIMMGGDFIPVSLPARIWALHPDIAIHSLGGPTETAIYSVEYPVTAVDSTWNSIPYGKPMRNRSCYIFDEQLNDRPDWVSGEIYIGRDTYIAQGYWRDTDRTAENFIIHPRNGERLFKTGDLGRYWPNGLIEILGRKDFQVKINGFRVELGEIETLLQNEAGVKQAVVTVKSRESNKKSLVAYIVPIISDTTKFQSLALSLKQKCIAKLPEYMVPHYFVELAELPLTANGKVNRQALPDLSIQPAHKQIFQAPRDELENQLVEIWQELLEQPKISVHDNFFQLGGHSLIAAQMITRLRDRLQIDASIRLIFDHPNIAALAAAISQIKQTQLTLPELPHLDPKQQALPLSYAQQRLWFVDQYEVGVDGYAAAYNMPLIWRIRGPLNVDALHHAVQVLVNRHAILRTIISVEKGKPQQSVLTEAKLPWRLVELEGYQDAQARYIRTLSRALEKPFELSKAPLMRALLFKWSSQDYSLLLNMHHIVTDAWSVGIISREIQGIYNSINRGLGHELSPPAYQYQDYAYWQRQVWEQGLMQAHEDYWLENLQNLPDPLDVLRKQPPQRGLSYAGQALPFELEPSLSRQVQAFAAAQGITPFIVLLANFKLLLHFYSGATDIIVGSDTANRQFTGSEGILGYFINQVAIRTQIDTAQTVNAYIEAVKDKVLRAFEHEAMPLDRLLDKLQLPRDLGNTPLFQVKLNYHSVEDEAFALDNLQVENEAIPYTTVHYNIVLTFKTVEDRIIGTLQYKTQLYSEAVMINFVEHYRYLLAQLVSATTARIDRLDYLPSNERARLASLGKAEQIFPQTLTLDQRFSQQAKQYANKIAVRDGEHVLTYAELDRASNRLAHALRKKGISVGDYVALYLTRDADQVIAILAVLKAGAVYVPLDTHSPGERIRYILQDAKPKLILADSDSLAQQALPNEYACILLNESDFSSQPEHVLPCRHTPHALAYIIYTSGTTGQPKGVVITHQQVGRLLDACQAYYRFNARDVWTLFHSYVFDFSVWELWGALCYGGRLIIIPHWLARSAEQMWNLIKAEGVTILNQTPSAFKTLSHAALRDSEKVSTKIKLRYVIFGGEALELNSLARWFEHFGERKPKLVNMYGITETTVHATLRPIRKADIHGMKSLIGKPLKDLEIYLLDENIRLLPQGVAGEIYIGGPGVTSGYLHNPQLTATRILPNPYASSNTRLYKSGDIARWTEQGELEYIGRADQQVKIRGHRIELGEIEGCLLKHASIKQAVVCCDFDEQRNARLIAYWQPYQVGSTQLNNEQLRDWVRQYLPDYMQPAVFLELEQMPLTINGKIDRKALPKPNLSDLNRRNYAKPSTDTEERLVTIISRLLAVDNVGVNHNFFEIGGHSLLATQLLAHIQETFEIELGLKTIFERSTIGELADAIEKIKFSEMVLDVLANDRAPAQEKEEFIL